MATETKEQEGKLNSMIVNGKAMEAFEEVAHRHWENGRVVREKFYYDTAN